jgi:hypothetical protein
VSFFHIVLFLSSKTLKENKLKNIHAILGFLSLFLCGIVIRYIQGFHMINHQKQLEQVEAHDELEITGPKGGFMFPFVYLSHHLENHMEAGMMGRVGGGKGKW